MEKIIGLKELRQNINLYAAGVRRGQSYVVARKSKPLFKLVPLEKEEGVWETAVDFTKISKGGVDIKDLLSRL